MELVGGGTFTEDTTGKVDGGEEEHGGLMGGDVDFPAFGLDLVGVSQ